MLAIRMQRRGRKGHAQYRVVVQDSRMTPKSERVVANIGSYDPHTKVAILDKEKASFYLGNGAQPSDRVARIFKNEDIKLPDWVKVPSKQSRETRNPDKLRKNQPAEEPVSEEAPVEAEESKDAPEEESTE